MHILGALVVFAMLGAMGYVAYCIKTGRPILGHKID
jgi:hypothetical protein